ncbi:UNVERIFIED_CONTAM: Zinc finger protein ZAT5 [Sesamum calycinum]|uniref:Zinc finger protein ZAT5 n=1 Tax=Sesamum calycinum TaxID=2727403 RepID=A0AAW2NX84_9LAMI
MQADHPEEITLIKGKRSKRPRPDSPPLALPMATLPDLSHGSSDPAVIPSPSNSGCDQLRQTADEEEEDMANCLILLAKGQAQKFSHPVAEVYQCKTCNKSFPSFQALGGHRASHKKPNKPPARVLGSPPHKSRVHECSICGAEFGSGQALGGHMRRHRPIPGSSHGESQEVIKRPRNLLSLDLNLPAPDDINDHPAAESKFPFAATKEQVIVFSASPLVDCHY